MTIEIAKLILQFMGRVQLTGAEVQAFNTVVAALNSVIEDKNGQTINTD